MVKMLGDLIDNHPTLKYNLEKTAMNFVRYRWLILPAAIVAVSFVSGCISPEHASSLSTGGASGGFDSYHMQTGGDYGVHDSSMEPVVLPESAMINVYERAKGVCTEVCNAPKYNYANWAGIKGHSDVFGLPEKIIEELGCFNDNVVQFLGVAKDWITNRTSISGDCFCYGVKNVCTPEKICSEFDGNVLCIGADALNP